MGWNFDVGRAPKGCVRSVTKTIGKNTVTVDEHVPVTIIAAGNDGVVTVSKWLAKEGRWSMFTKAVPPMAWQPWPAHPHAEEGCSRSVFE